MRLSGARPATTTLLSTHELGSSRTRCGAAAADGSLTVADLRQELRSFAESLHE
jgi:hypothetical protein